MLNPHENDQWCARSESELLIRTADMEELALHLQSLRIRAYCWNAKSQKFDSVDVFPEGIQTFHLDTASSLAPATSLKKRRWQLSHVTDYSDDVLSGMLSASNLLNRPPSGDTAPAAVTVEEDDTDHSLLLDPGTAGGEEQPLGQWVGAAPQPVHNAAHCLEAKRPDDPVKPHHSLMPMFCPPSTDRLDDPVKLRYSPMPMFSPPPTYLFAAKPNQPTA